MTEILRHLVLAYSVTTLLANRFGELAGGGLVADEVWVLAERTLLGAPMTAETKTKITGSMGDGGLPDAATISLDQARNFLWRDEKLSGDYVDMLNASRAAAIKRTLAWHNIAQLIQSKLAAHQFAVAASNELVLKRSEGSRRKS